MGYHVRGERDEAAQNGPEKRCEAGSRMQGGTDLVNDTEGRAGLRGTFLRGNEPGSRGEIRSHDRIYVLAGKKIPSSDS